MKRNVLILLILLGSFLYPAYAQSQDDPIVNEEVVVSEVLPDAVGQEIVIPDTPEEAGELLNAAIKAAEGGHWAIFAGFLIMLVIWGLRRVNWLNSVPDQYIPWISAGIGIVSYVAIALAAGTGVRVAITQGCMAGVEAVGLWELVFKRLLGKKEETPE